MRKVFLILIITLSIQEVSSQTKVFASVYNAVASQCNADYLHTAWMFKLDPANPFKHRIIAVSRDLIAEYPNGTKVRLKGTKYDGIYTVRDKMGKKSKHKITKDNPLGLITQSIDILINEDMQIGIWNNVTITKL